MKKTIYFAYGSNMNIEQMKNRCPRADNLGPAVLKDWELVERLHADIAPKRGSEVHGVVWGVTAKCMKSLDAYEAFPRYYYKKKVWVKMYGCAARVQAIVYIMTDQATAKKQNQPFGEWYARGCAKGARDNGLPVHPLFAKYEVEKKTGHPETGREDDVTDWGEEFFFDWEEWEDEFDDEEKYYLTKVEER